MYHTAKGEFVISPDSTTALDISLKPNFGYIKVNSTPEAAATVRINNSSAGKTPYTSDRLRSGVYTVSVFKAMYQSATQEVSVTDGETSAVTLAMTPDFAEPVITCSDPNAEIWVNGEKKGVGSWNGRLAAGVYKIKASRKSHIDTGKAFTLNAGDNTQIDLDPPTPIYGFLQVASTPFAADIYLDGQKVGTTPKLLNNILIGDHELRIEKNDYATEVRNIKVEENKTTDISVELKNRETIKRTESVRTEENVYTDLASTETGNKAKRHHYAWITFVTLYSYKPRTFLGADVAFGFMISLNKFLFSAEIVTTNFKTIEFKLGLGLYHQ